MRDVSAKLWTLRTATARASIKVSPNSIIAIRNGTVPKGDPLPVAKVAAIQAVKNTPQLIPYCHTVPIEHVGVDFVVEEDRIIIEVSVKSIYKTGVEMEAMAGAMVAALNIYDILKMIDDDMVVERVELLEKKGGKSQYVPLAGWTFSVVVASDRASNGEREDGSGRILVEGLQQAGGILAELQLVPDEVDDIRAAVFRQSSNRVHLVAVTGGTGLAPRDVTPEALEGLITRSLPGVETAFHDYGRERTPFAMLSRMKAGVVDQSVVLALPGSPSAVRDALDALFPYLAHAFQIIQGEGHE